MRETPTHAEGKRHRDREGGRQRNREAEEEQETDGQTDRKGQTDRPSEAAELVLGKTFWAMRWRELRVLATGRPGTRESIGGLAPLGRPLWQEIPRRTGGWGMRGTGGREENSSWLS